MGEEQKTHTHILEDGTVVEHSHGEHTHHHSHAHTKAVLNRLSRAIGHMESIILQDHIEHCIVDAVEHGDKDAIKELEIAIDRFMK